MTKILITGGLGYLGSKLASACRHSFDEIRIVDNFSHQLSHGIAIALQDMGCEIFKEDIRNKESIQEHVKWSDRVVHLAAIVGFPACQKDPERAISTNLEATKYIVDALDYRQLIFPNTNSGYGTTTGNQECTEDSPMNPITLYGKTKTEAENYIVKNAYNYTVFRLATVYGASLRPRLDLLVNNFAWKAWKDKCNVIYEGHVMRNYIDINTVCQAFYDVMKSKELKDKVKKQIFNLGDDNLNCTKLELANRIAKIIPHEILEGKIGSDPDKRNYRVSNAKANAIGLVQTSEATFDRQIKKLIDQFKILDQPTFGNY